MDALPEMFTLSFFNETNQSFELLIQLITNIEDNSNFIETR